MPERKSTSTKREELVDIASALFYKQGFGATGIKQIIDTAGIAKGTFYSHFTSKEEVGLAWLKKRHTVWNLLALFDFLEGWMTECDFRGCAFLNTLAEVPDPSNPMRKEILSHKEGLQKQIQELAIAHFSNKPKAFGKQKGTILFLLFEGALIEAQNFREVAPIVSAKKELKTFLAT
jgi:AcrR family transcriptional regulator